MSTLVLGIGNTLLSDEGIGVYVLRALQSQRVRNPRLTLLDGGTLSFSLLEDIVRADRMIVLDAARVGTAPGAIACMEGEAMDAFLRGNRMSVHEVSLSDLLDMARLRGALPRHRALLTIEPADLTWGAGPSPAVGSVVPKVAAMVLELAERWEGEDLGESSESID